MRGQPRAQRSGSVLLLSRSAGRQDKRTGQSCRPRCSTAHVFDTLDTLRPQHAAQETEDQLFRNGPGSRVAPAMGLGGTGTTLDALYKNQRFTAVIPDTAIRDYRHKKGNSLASETDEGVHKSGERPGPRFESRGARLEQLPQERCSLVTLGLPPGQVKCADHHRRCGKSLLPVGRPPILARR